MARISAELPRGEHVVIEGAGHNAPNSHPAEFVEQLIQPLLR
jgi:pimeloyl-ACP methyl ester carboxylesterase